MATTGADMPVSLDDLAVGPSGGVERVIAWHGKPQPGIQPREPGARQAQAAGTAVIIYRRRMGNRF